MATMRANVPDLYTPVFNEMILESDAYGEETTVMPKIFDVKTMKNGEGDKYETSSLSSLGRWTVTNESANVNFEDPIQGYNSSFTPLKYTNAFQVSFEALDDDRYAVLKKEDEVKAMGRGARDASEAMAAGHFNNAFTAGATAGADGVALCSNSHPKNPEETGTLYDNYTTDALSHDAIETMFALIDANMKDSKGIIVEVPSNPLLVTGSLLHPLAKRLVSDMAKERPETVNRDINVWAGELQPVKWRHITSSTAWFIVFRNMGLKFIWREKPHFRSWINEGTEQYCFKGRMRAVSGWSDWRGVWGSDGTT